MIFKHYNRIVGSGLAGFRCDAAAVAGTELASEAVCVRSCPGGDGGATTRTDEWKVAYTCTLRSGEVGLDRPALSMATA